MKCFQRKPKKKKTKKKKKKKKKKKTNGGSFVRSDFWDLDFSKNIRKVNPLLP